MKFVITILSLLWEEIKLINSNGILIEKKLNFADAITLYPFIVGKNLDKITLNHERIHMRQEAEMLIIPFYLWYVVEYLVKRFKYGNDAYYHISFEKESYYNQFDPNYLSKRKPYSWVKYIL